MNKYFYRLLLFLLVFNSFSCTNHEDEWLLRLAENEMSSYQTPDSALVYLEQIDFPEKLDEKNFAKYIFLLTKAHYRNKISIKNDTLISVAIEYYRKSKADWYLAESNLYAGRIYEVRGETEKAKAFFLEAFELAILLADYEQAGRCAYGLGELYLDAKDFQEAINWLELALTNFHKSGQLFHEINTLRRIGDYYVLTGQTDQAISFFEKALAVTPAENYALQSDLLKNMAIAFSKSGEYEQAKGLIKRSIAALPKEKQYPIQYNILADIYLEQAQPDSAILCFQKVLTYMKRLGNYASLCIPEKSIDGQDVDMAEQQLMKEKYQLYRTVSDTIYQKQTYESLPPPAKLQAKERLLHQNKMLSNRNQRYIILIILVLAAIPLIAYPVFVLLRRRNLALIDKENIIKRMKVERKKNEKVMTTYKMSNEEYLKGYVRMVQLSISPQRNKYKNFLLEYNKIMYNTDDEFNFNWSVFQDLLSNAYIQYIDKLRLTFTHLGEKEIRSIAMQKAGFEIADIAELFGYSIHTVYKRNSEIRKKIKLTESGNIVEFIDKELSQKNVF